ncbi:peptidylprolyl isomerase [Polaribacter sp. SA4-10]|uniref:peptidylprolyl isomerase n=1 Tax=Polaribacter sp. SA4-10 TaxID=754397 RepID=UPI000B3D313B|nr:peptidylprolyl isomerase [Polaribacter sp. SA4-10]ARV05380.1 peptidylprolyl isomerase [Polaribacter sp. SA4-10]
MKNYHIIFLLLLLTSFYQCDNNKKPTQKSVVLSKEKKVKKEVITKAWDSLNRHNTEAFLTEYGKQNTENKVIIKTDFGDIKIRLYNDTPVHRANFIFLTKINYFNTTVFYRIAKNFVLQGGNSDEMYTMKQRRKYGNYLMKPEFRKNRKHKYGALAAARQWEKNPDKLSSPFEFYIVQKRSGAHHLDGEHTVFGEVISGFSVMDKMSKVKVGVDEWPVDDVKMKVAIIE